MGGFFAASYARPQRVLGGKTPDGAPPQAANQRWGVDLASDVPANGRRFRVLVVADGFTRERPAPAADAFHSSRHVVFEPDASLSADPLAPRWTFP